jgi:hypothetical protein
LIATGYAEMPEGTDPDLPRIAKPFSQRGLEAAVMNAITTHRRPALTPG